MYPTKRLLKPTALYVSLLALAACSAQENSTSEPYAPVKYADLIKAPSPETLELMSINPELERQIIKVADNVHVAVGYAASVFTFIEGNDGIVMIDTGQLTDASTDALAEYRKISDKPITGIVFTHSHGDHIGGIAPFIDRDNPPKIWARNNFGDETQAFRGSGIRINAKRGVRQAGFMLPPEQRINNGIAPPVYPKKETFNPAKSFKVTNEVSGDTQISISGITLVLANADGETADQISIWYPDKRIVFAGDNFYQSWPNLYAIRGTPYRDVQAWAKTTSDMRALKADVLVGGHTLPIIGAENVDHALGTYHAGISYIFDKTIEGINKGLGPDELVEYAKLPAELANERVLRPFYGNPDWAIRAIFQGYLGWYDGNPTNLFPLLPKKEALKMVELAGGEAAMMEQLRTAVTQSEDQWATQLADYLLLINPGNAEAMRLKADALTRLAEKNPTATARNYYLTYARELRTRAK